MSRAASLARRAGKHAVRTFSSSGLRLLGEDVTASFAGRGTLVVAPHPDDETFGCGAAIARMRALGTRVDVVFVTDGGRSPRPAGMTLEDLLRLRRTEATMALGILGVDRPAVHLDFEDGTLTARRSDVTDALVAVLRSTDPGQVLVTSSRDRHPDHAAVAAAVGAAAARCAGHLPVYEYPIWQRVPVLTVARDAAGTARRAPADGGRDRPRRPRLVRTDGFLEAKKRAVAVYASQLPHFPAGFVEDFMLPFETFVQRTPDVP